MIEVMPESAGGSLAFRARGELTDDDYQRVFIPRLEEALAAHGRLRVMLVLEDDFKGWSPRAMWDDARWGMKHRNDFVKLAVVGGPTWVGWATRVGGRLMSSEVKTFALDQWAEAWAWVES
jgi:hypothetical protein